MAPMASGIIDRYAAYLPITEQMCAIMSGRSPREALEALMARELKSEV